MSIINRYLSYHLRESHRSLAAWHCLAPQQVGQCRSSHRSGMERIKHGRREFDFFSYSQRTSCHYNGNHRFARFCQSCNQLALCTLQVQVGQAMRLSGKNGFLTHKCQNDISTYCGGGSFGHAGHILVTAISQAQFVYHLYFVSHQFLDGSQRCHSLCLVAIKYPGTQLVVWRIRHRAYHGNCLYRRLQRQCLLFVLQQDGRFHSSLLGSLQMSRSIKFLYTFLIYIRVIKQPQAVLDAQNIPHCIIYGRFLDFSFFYQLRQFLDKRIADHLHIHTGIHCFHRCLFGIGRKAMRYHFGYRSPV